MPLGDPHLSSSKKFLLKLANHHLANHQIALIDFGKNISGDTQKKIGGSQKIIAISDVINKKSKKKIWGNQKFVD